MSRSSRRCARRPPIASGRGAPETAATCLRRALEEPPPRALRGPLLLELGLAQMAACRDPLAVAEFREAITLIETPPERLAAALRAGRALGVAGYFEEAVAILEQVPGFDLRIEAERSHRRIVLRVESLPTARKIDCMTASYSVWAPS